MSKIAQTESLTNVSFGMDCSSKAERNAKIHARRIAGLTLAAISREFKLSVETVREIAKVASGMWLELLLA